MGKFVQQDHQLNWHGRRAYSNFSFLLSKTIAGVLLGAISLLLVQSTALSQELASTEKYRSSINIIRQGEDLISLKVVLADLEKQYQVNFSYEPKVVDDKFVSEKSVIPNELENTLKILLQPLNLQHKQIEKGFYVIQPAKIKVEKINKKSSFRKPDNDEADLSGSNSMELPRLHALKESLQKEAYILSGRVTDENNNGLLGVTVRLKDNPTVGTVTDIDGNYRISIPDGQKQGVLLFSFIGYLSEEVPINNRTTINVQLLPDVESLSEVVVVGYGTQIKKDVTGSVSSVKGDEVKNIPVASADALLQGKAAGVQVVQNSGTPGGEVFVRVRGTTSLLGETRPLYVIDGVPMNNSSAFNASGQRPSTLADINPNDIESMEILKDAAATAIYGARGSNGVILITTKRGKSGRARISLDAYSGVQTIAKTLDLLNGQQYIDVLRESITNRNPDLLNNAPYNELAVTGINTNYQNEIFRSAPISNYSVSVTGGADKLSTYLSLGYFRQQGTIIGQDYRRVTGRLNLDYQATDRLKVGTSTTFSSSTQDRVENDFGGLSILGNALVRNPNLPVYNEDGSYSVDPLRTENPVQLANEVPLETVQRRIVSNIYADFKILDGLNFRSLVGVDYLDERAGRYIPSTIVSRNGRARADAYFLDEQTIINDNTLSFSKTIDKHRIGALAGLGIQRSRSAYLSTGGENAGSDIVTTVGAIADPFRPSQNIGDWGLLSYFGRANYSFMDKYLLEASFRVDGSSRFGENNRYGTFPGLSIGWRVSEEAFMQGIRPITDMKIRAGIGVTGNQEGIGNYPSQALYGTGRNYDGNPGIGQSNIPNVDLAWESTTSTNLGVDLALFNARVHFTADAYLKKIDNLIFPRQLPWTSGFWSIGNANIGEMENRGLEFALTTRNLTGEFQWTTDFNIAFNRNEITSLPVNGEAGSDYIFKMPDAYGVEGPYSIYRVGEPIGSFYGYVYQGVYARDEDVPRLVDPAEEVDDLYERGVRGGDANFADINNDGVLDRQFDRAIIGNALPKHTGGITNNFSYKKFDLNVIVNWSYGNDVYNMTRNVLTSMSEDYNQSTEVLSRWRQQGDVTDIPRAMYGSSSVSGAAPTDASSRYIEDGSFLRFRNITFGYNIPSAALQTIGIASARLYVSGQNLITITNYSGLDPENQNLGFGIPTLGVDYLTQPQPRVFMAGINIGF
ncbi:TonB-dependent receptor plug [Flammeovirgaceae bacterium 311]|nr:TonB-dependent receptor plug [Flammeovirgaceae bacterium 311]